MAPDIEFELKKLSSSIEGKERALSFRLERIENSIKALEDRVRVLEVLHERPTP